MGDEAHVIKGPSAPNPVLGGLRVAVSGSKDFR